MDTTHGPNMYDFHLITLMTVDEYGQGLSVAWMICNWEDISALIF